MGSEDTQLLLQQQLIQLHQEGFRLNLQRFASAESEGRTEDASEHKKRKAREEGRVALSKEMPAVVVTIAAYGVLVVLGKYVYDVISEAFYYIFAHYNELSVFEYGTYKAGLLDPIVKVFSPMAAIAFIVALLSNYGQIGGMKFYAKPLKPDFKKVNPNIFKFFAKQVFSMTGFFNLLKSIVKVLIISAVAIVVIMGHIDEVLLLPEYESLAEAFLFVVKVCSQIIFYVMILLLIFSIVDIIFVHWQYKEELKMKKEEVKQEFKDLEGDPHVKAKLKQMYQSMLTQQKMLDEVPTADVVITNPTHFAVALKYDQMIDEAPRVIAKGQDAFAQKIKEVARENNVYMYENVPLARKLYADVEVNQFIPNELFGLVIVAYKLAYQHKNRSK